MIALIDLYGHASGGVCSIVGDTTSKHDFIGQFHRKSAHCDDTGCQLRLTVTNGLYKSDRTARF